MHVMVNAISAKAGGIVTYTVNLIRELASRHVHATVSVPVGFASPALASDTVKLEHRHAVHYGPLRRLLWEQIVWRREVSASRADVVFSSANYAILHSRVPQLLLLREGGLFNPFYRRHVMPDHSASYRAEASLRRGLMVQSARHATVVMFPSETMRDWVLAYAPDLRGKAVVNHYGTYAQNFHRPTRRPWRADGALKLLFVSVYYPHKNPRTLAHAVRILNERGTRASARITMDQAEFQLWPSGRAEYVEMSEPRTLSHLHFGPVPYRDLPDVYADHDVFVFPSVSETFGHPLVEAMASGVPVIAADTLTNREICGPVALYYPSYDAESLVQRVLDLDADPDLRRWMTEQGRARVARYFTWDAHIQRLLTTLSDLTQAGAAQMDKGVLAPSV